jgi:hypothetical protein
MKCLGLDLSTTVCGYAITEDKKILHAGFIDISKLPTYKEKADLIIKTLEGKTFDRIIIEESLIGWGGGKKKGGGSQQVIIKLVKNKAVIGYILETHYGITVESLHAQTARKKALGAARLAGMKAKPFVKMMVDKLYDMTPWTVYNKIGNPDKKMEDLYDALVLSLAG